MDLPAADLHPSAAQYTWWADGQLHVRGRACGFSAATNTLNELLPEYHTVCVLEDPEIREGIKAYGDWPTIPQLYVEGELVGGADIIRQMYGSGELRTLFDLASDSPASSQLDQATPRKMALPL